MKFSTYHYKIPQNRNQRINAGLTSLHLKRFPSKGFINSDSGWHNLIVKLKHWVKIKDSNLQSQNIKQTPGYWWNFINWHQICIVLSYYLTIWLFDYVSILEGISMNLLNRYYIEKHVYIHINVYMYFHIYVYVQHI